MRGWDFILVTSLLIPEGDVLVHAGDFTGVGHKREVEVFKNFLLSLPHQHKVGK